MLMEIKVPFFDNWITIIAVCKLYWFNCPRNKPTCKGNHRTHLPRISGHNHILYNIPDII